MKTSPSFARRTKLSTAFCGPGWMCWSSARAWSREAEPVRLFFINRFFHPDQSATAQLLTDLAVGLATYGIGVTVLTGRLGYLGGEIAVRAGTLREGLRARLFRWAANWSLRKSDRVIVVGRCMERCLLAFGLQRDRVVLIPNWADGDHLTPVAPEDNWFRKQHGLEGQIVVMYSGNLGVVHETEAVIPLIRYLQGMREVCFLFVVV